MFDLEKVCGGGEWFNLDYVKLTLDNGKSFTFSKGLYLTTGKPSYTESWTTRTSYTTIESPSPLEVSYGSGPSRDGESYTWMESDGFSSFTETYKYTINTGTYHTRKVSSWTYEYFFVESISDEDLKMIAESKVVDIEFYSKDPLKPPKIYKGIDNKSAVKQAVYDYYINHK